MAPNFWAIIIEIRGDLFYSEILRKVEGDPTLSELGKQGTKE